MFEGRPAATSLLPWPPRRVPASGRFLSRLARLVLSHRKAVVAAWVLVLLAGAASAQGLSKRLSFSFSLPGQPGYQTATQVLRTWGNGGSQPPDILVVSAPAGSGIAADQARVGAAFEAVRQADPALRVLDLANTGDRRFVTDDGRSTFALVFGPPPSGFGPDRHLSAATALLARQLPGYQVRLTGLDRLEEGGSSKGPGVLAETLVGAAGALALLAVVFASFLAVVPLVIAAVAILTTFLVVTGLTYLTQVSFIVQFLISLIGLGVAIDYSLLLVTRWREERARGADNSAAVVRAVETAGRAVVVSGLTVAVGLLALAVLPVPALRSTGIGGMLIPLVSILVVNTLLPALLGGVGPRVDWPRLRSERQASRLWSAWATQVVRHRWAAAGTAIALLAVLALPALHLKAGYTDVKALARTGPARAAYQQLVDGGVPQGVLTPIEVVAHSGVARPTVQALDHVPGVETAALASDTSGTRSGLSDIVVLPKLATVNSTSLAPVRAVQAAVGHRPGVIGVTGAGAILQDFSRAIYGNVPLMATLIGLLTFLLLARALRSLVLAAKAVVLNLASLAATFGLVTWFWQEGHGSQAVFGIAPTGAITFWIPLMVFSFLFGLSMDYEVFILTRVREEYDRSGNTDSAVVEGLGRTGRLVTSAALILFLAFASLASAPVTDIKVLATALGAGILLDASVIRALLVPALVSLFGRWNWWMPTWASRLLRADRSQPLAPAAPAAAPLVGLGSPPAS